MPPPSYLRQPSAARATDQMRPCQIRYSTPSCWAWALSQLTTAHPCSSAGPVAGVPMLLPNVPSQARPSGCSEGPDRGDQHDHDEPGKAPLTWARMYAVRAVILPSVVGSSTSWFGSPPG